MLSILPTFTCKRDYLCTWRKNVRGFVCVMSQTLFLSFSRNVVRWLDVVSDQLNVRWWQSWDSSGRKRYATGDHTGLHTRHVAMCALTKTHAKGDTSQRNERRRSKWKIVDDREQCMKPGAKRQRTENDRKRFKSEGAPEKRCERRKRSAGHTLLICKARITCFVIRFGKYSHTQARRRVEAPVLIVERNVSIA